MTELRFHDLLGRKVFETNGRILGRIEEIVAEEDAGTLVVKEFHVGTFALLVRLAGASIGRALLGSAGARLGKGYIVPAEALDLADPLKPRLKCERSELRAPPLDDED